jgi:hypothetical protein
MSVISRPQPFPGERRLKSERTELSRSDSLSSAETQRDFSGGENPLSDVSAGAELCEGRRRNAREPLPYTTPKMAAIRGRQFWFLTHGGGVRILCS